MESRYRYASVDTNILIRIVAPDDEEQYRRALSLILNGDDYYIDDYVVMETVYVLEKEKYSRREIVDSLSCLFKNDVFIYNEKFFKLVFERYLSRPSLSFNDCVIEARVKEKNALPLWTFDRKFARQSSTTSLLDN